jgi:hypothetical protein
LQALDVFLTFSFLASQLVGIRIPDHAFMLDLAQMFGGPLALTSANLSSQASSLSVEVRIGPSRLNCCFLKINKANTVMGLPGRNLGLWCMGEKVTHLVLVRGGYPNESWKGAGGVLVRPGQGG